MVGKQGVNIRTAAAQVDHGIPTITLQRLGENSTETLLAEIKEDTLT